MTTRYQDPPDPVFAPGSFVVKTTWLQKPTGITLAWSNKMTAFPHQMLLRMLTVMDDQDLKLRNDREQENQRKPIDSILPPKMTDS